MNFFKLVKALSVSLVFISSSTIAGNSPSSGEPFQDLQDQIDALVQHIEDVELPPSSDATTFVVHANNVEIGYLIGIDTNKYIIASDNVYIINAYRFDGRVSFTNISGFEGLTNFFFSTSDCSGTYYGNFVAPGTVFTGIVPNSSGEEALYYTPKDEIVLSRNIKSQYGQISYDPATSEYIYGCQDLTTIGHEIFMNTVNVVPFDEGVTGFSLSIFNSELALDLPLTIEKK